MGSSFAPDKGLGSHIPYMASAQGFGSQILRCNDKVLGPIRVRFKGYGLRVPGLRSRV